MPICYVLHSRPYKETSALVELFSAQGRSRAVLRGARGRVGSLARAFSPLELDLRGKSDLKTVTRIEAAGQPVWLVGGALFSGLYLNELLLRLLAIEDAQPELFEHYRLTLDALALGRPLEPLLRSFEWRLLCTLGYGFSLTEDIKGQHVEPGGQYRLVPEAGLERIGVFQPGVFAGDELLAMAATDWDQPGVLHAAKRLMRQALAPHLGGRPLASRELFINFKETPRD